MLVNKRPTFGSRDAETLASKHYGLTAKAKELPSERDQNFLLKTNEREMYLLKIAHPDEAREVLDFQARALDLLTAPYYPKLCPDKTGQQLIEITSEQDVNHFMRLLTFLPGTPVAEHETLSPVLLGNIGRAIGEMDRALSSFTHPAMNRHLLWDSKHALETVRGNLSYISKGKRNLVEHYLTIFERDASPLLPGLRQSVIHNDVNDYNLLVEGDGVTGIIDFGDMVYTYAVCDLANACTYLMMDKPEPLETARHVASGYLLSYSLEPEEIAVLLDFIYLRLCLSVSMSAKQRAQNPDNDYLSISERPAWDLLETLAQAPITQLRESLNTALSN